MQQQSNDLYCIIVCDVTGSMSEALYYPLFVTAIAATDAEANALVDAINNKLFARFGNDDRFAICHKLNKIDIPHSSLDDNKAQVNTNEYVDFIYNSILTAEGEL